MTEFSFRTRRQNLERMAREEFDLLVIGGGIHGAGVARDAALRGLKVALVEKGDFASGTSSKSSKLIHGGLRYLEQFDFSLVRESCRERAILRQIAPHLVKPIRFLIPIYRGVSRPRWMIRCGMRLYDLLSPDRLVERPTMMSPERALFEEPALEPKGLLGAATYWDCQENDARFCLANIVDAAEHGAVCANYLEITAFGVRSDRIETAAVSDVLSNATFQVRARIFVNAGGPWVGRIAGLAPTPSLELRPTKGVHLVTRRLTRTHALLLQTRRDRRVFFVLPWGTNHSMIGTTDTDFSGEPDRVEADASDVAYLLDEVNRALTSNPLKQTDVLSTFAGLRPLLEQPGRSPSDVTRRHKIVASSAGLISIVGGKYTTCRSVAQEVVDLVCRKLLEKVSPCTTASRPLAPSFLPILPGAHLPSDVRYAIDHEMAMTVDDFLFRRTMLGYTENQLAPFRKIVADEMQKSLGWSDQQTMRQQSGPPG